MILNNKGRTSLVGVFKYDSIKSPNGNWADRVRVGENYIIILNAIIYLTTVNEDVL